ncbi:MAG: SseB family protein [Chloroflexota bacterium]
MTSQADAPAPGSHDPSTPTGSLETSAASLFETMLAARDAQGRGDARPLESFHRALMDSTLLLPVPPGTDAEARQALERAVTDSEEVEIAVMLARDGEGATVNVLFASPGALSAWAPVGTTSLPLPARIVFGNLAASGLPAIMDPAGPIPYRFEPDEIAALAEGRRPGSDEPLVAPTVRRSLSVRLPGRQAEALEASVARALAETRVESAYLVETDAGDGPHLLLGLTGDPGAAATVDVPDRTDVVWLEEPLLSQVRAVADPFYRRGRQ